MITIIILCTVLQVGFSEPPLFNSKPFRPSQPYPLTDRIQSEVPTKQYGPPKPVYGAPGRPDDTIEPTTPPNNFKSTPSKFSFGQVQGLPQKDHRGMPLVFPSKQMSAQQFNQLSQQQLPGFNQLLFKPQQKLQTFRDSDSVQGQLLPNPVRIHTFTANKGSSQLVQVPQSFQQLPFRNFNFEIQKSQEFQLRDATPTRAPPSNVNFNNQNTINVQTPPLFNINTAPKHKMSRNNNQRLKMQPSAKLSSKMVSGDHSQIQFSNEDVLSAKRAASARRGGKAKMAPSRQYLSPESTTSKPVVPPTIRRRPTTTEATETQNVPIGRGPNVAVSNSFAGRLFLLQPDGRLEPVVLKRANENYPNVADKNIISPAELLQPIFNGVPLSIPK